MAELPEREMESLFAEVMSEARRRGFTGFGGDCGSAALAIHEVVFGGGGELVIGVNAFFWDRGRAIGHAAVSYRGAFWDADGRAKDYDDVTSWGMLDESDTDYQMAARDLGANLTARRAERAALYAIPREEFHQNWFSGAATLDDLRGPLASAAAERLRTRTLDRGRGLGH